MYTGIDDLQNGYQPRNDTAKGESSDLVTDAYGILYILFNLIS
jgi:hypothetical protein